MNFIEAMKVAEEGYKTWSEKPHNAKWVKRIDGTPIPNDLLVNIAEAFVGHRMKSAGRAEASAWRPDINALVDKFLAWQLPAGVCSDTCVTEPNHPFLRSGTNLLSADEARQMFEYLFQMPLPPPPEGGE